MVRRWLGIASLQVVLAEPVTAHMYVSYTYLAIVWQSKQTTPSQRPHGGSLGPMHECAYRPMNVHTG